jgi:hypothetical protein
MRYRSFGIVTSSVGIGYRLRGARPRQSRPLRMMAASLDTGRSPATAEQFDGSGCRLSDLREPGAGIGIADCRQDRAAISSTRDGGG